MLIYIYRVPGIGNPPVFDLFSEKISFDFRRKCSPLLFILVVNHRDGHLLRLVFEELPETVFQGGPGIIDLIDQKQLLELVNAERRLFVDEATKLDNATRAA